MERQQNTVMLALSDGEVNRLLELAESFVRDTGELNRKPDSTELASQCLCLSGQLAALALLLAHRLTDTLLDDRPERLN